MDEAEIKLQCLRIACDVMGVHIGSIAGYAVDGTTSRVSVEDVLDKTKLIYEWAKESDA